MILWPFVLRSTYRRLEKEATDLALQVDDLEEDNDMLARENQRLRSELEEVGLDRDPVTGRFFSRKNQEADGR